MGLVDFAICVTFVWICLTNAAWPFWTNPARAPYVMPLSFGGLFVMGVLLVYKYGVLHGGCAIATAVLR